MTTQRFSHTQYPINALVEQIDSGELSLPDLQRPFVWKRSRVRDLFDSLYHGYPAGYFLLWSTPAAVDSHKVATAPGASSKRSPRVSQAAATQECPAVVVAI